MRRALLAAALLAVPLLGGFECEVTLWAPGDTCTVGGWSDSQCDGNTLLYCDAGTGFVESTDCAAECTGGYCGSDVYGYNWCVCPDYLGPGDTCDYWTDYPSTSFCYGANSLLMCNMDNVMQQWDCTDACPSGVVGYCAYDADQGNDWCLCPDALWADGYACDFLSQVDDATCDGDLLTYCADTNVIGSVPCTSQCADWYGAAATASCGIQDDTGYNGCVCDIATCTFAPFCNDSYMMVWCNEGLETWTNCDSQCVTDGYLKGVCLAGTGACQCG